MQRYQFIPVSVIEIDNESVIKNIYRVYKTIYDVSLIDVYKRQFLSIQKNAACVLVQHPVDAFQKLSLIHIWRR